MQREGPKTLSPFLGVIKSSSTLLRTTPEHYKRTEFKDLH